MADKNSEKHRRIWCAYMSDGSDYVLFSTELQAMRFAVANGMACQPVDFGVSLRELTGKKPQPQQVGDG